MTLPFNYSKIILLTSLTISTLIFSLSVNYQFIVTL